MQTFSWISQKGISETDFDLAMTIAHQLPAGILHNPVHCTWMLGDWLKSFQNAALVNKKQF